MGGRAKAGHLTVEVLTRAGVRRFYTVPGESFLEILDAAERYTETSLVSTRHESGASFMAEAKVTGRPAVAMATRGVGASNLAIGVHTAMQDSTPMVVLLGQVETDFLDHEAFQEVDLTAFYGPITKWATTVHRADRIPELVARAVRVATSGRPGPVMLALPADILGEEIEERGSRLSEGRPRSVPDPEDVEDVVRRLVAAERPVVIAGGGARHSQEALIRFAESSAPGSTPPSAARTSSRTGTRSILAT
jgi:acetolactate synthase-1/2/3 large subunit